MKKTVILTTYPKHTTMNVGDSLITNSLVKLISKRMRNFPHEVVFREALLDDYGVDVNILAPGFSLRDNTYPKLYRLYSDISKIKSFIPLGCSLQYGYPGEKIFRQYNYSKSTYDFLKMMTSRFGPFPCRDQMIVKMLNDKGLPAEYSGDLALFDPDKIGTKFSALNEVKSLVVTLHHRERYDTQAINLISLLSYSFPDARKYVSLHSLKDERTNKIARFASSANYSILELAGESENLDIYNEIDLHVGYRLHGHIYFLRNRKPSVLLVEDTRSYGFSRTDGTSEGCFDAMDEHTLKVNKDKPLEILSYINSQLKQGFIDFMPVFDFIDKTYSGYLSKKIDDIVGEICS